MNLDSVTEIYVSIGLTAGVIALVGGLLRRRKFRPLSVTNENLLNAIIERQSPGSKPPRVCRPAEGAPQVSVLEGHLRNAILDARARERLVNDAMSTTGGDRAAAIRKVLGDLNEEDKRWS